MRAGAKQQLPSDKKYVRHYMMFQSIAVSQTPIKTLLHLILTPLPPPPPPPTSLPLFTLFNSNSLTFLTHNKNVSAKLFYSILQMQSRLPFPHLHQRPRARNVLFIIDP